MASLDLIQPVVGSSVEPRVFCTKYPKTRWLTLLLGPPDKADEAVKLAAGREPGLPG